MNDLIATLTKVFADKASDQWRAAKITKKKADLLKSFDFDISALIREMNAMDALL